MEKVLSIILIIAIVAVVLVSCSKPKEKETTTQTTEITTTVKKSQLKEAFDGDTCTVTFDKQKVNKLLIKLNKVSKENIQIFNGETLIYEQKNNSNKKYCCFNTIETDKLTIKGIKKDNFSSIQIKYNQSSIEDFRVTAYIVADRIVDMENLDSDSFDIITDVILFSCVSFDENGNIYYTSHEGFKGEKFLNKALSNLREVIGQRDVKIYVNILGPSADSGISDWNKQMANKGEKHNKAFKNDKLIPSISELINDHNFDGVFFDYEYPIEKKYWNKYNKFLIDLKTEIGDKKLGIALASWDVKLSEKAIESVDMIELMSYDMFDDYGDHASYDTAVSDIDKLISAGIPKERIDLGIPFYARPTDKGAFWYEYKKYSKQLGKSGNVWFIEEQEKDAYFNSYQLTYDKTDLALTKGLGGMMVWHYSCDDFNGKYSLFDAMNEAKSDRIN